MKRKKTLLDVHTNKASIKWGLQINLFWLLLAHPVYTDKKVPLCWFYEKITPWYFKVGSNSFSGTGLVCLRG